MIGKTLGQFFTPPKVKEMMVNLINQRLYPDGTTESIFDPAMGTGGFLITCLRNLIQKSKVSGVKLNWEFLTKNSIISGRECEPDTYQLAVSNMLISSGNMFFLEQGDSIRDPITAKYDIVMANPPFGIKGLEYDEITHPLRNEYLPISSKSSTPLFLQAIIYMLKVNGRCAVVLPEGQDLFSKSKSLVAVREYLMKTCELKEVIYLPPGMFTHTTIKTCVFYFHKRKEGKEVLEIKAKKGIEFIPEHQTKSVKFFEFDGTTKQLIVEVGIEDIAKNTYSLNSAEYLTKAEPMYTESSGSIVMKTLGEICDFLPKSKRSASYGKPSGAYPFFKSSLRVTHYVDEPDFTKESIIFGDGGEPNVNYGTNFSVSDHCYVLQNKNPQQVNMKYVYYYCYHDLDNIADLFTGVAIKNISKSKIASIVVPIPALEKQNEIVKRLDFILEKSVQTSRNKIQELRQSKKLFVETNLVVGVSVKTFGEVCDFQNGYAFKSTEFQPKGENNYGIIQIKSIHNGLIESSKITEYIPREQRLKKFEVVNGDILLSLTGDCGKIGLYKLSGVSYLNQRVAKIVCKNISPLYFYCWYVSCDIESQIAELAKGTAQPNVSTHEIATLTIPVPSIEKQQEIIEFCEACDSLINQLEKDMKRNEKFAKTLITGGEEEGNRKRKHNNV
jgi:restriction endonuclease S subunit